MRWYKPQFIHIRWFAVTAKGSDDHGEYKALTGETIPAFDGYEYAKATLHCLSSDTIKLFYDYWVARLDYVLNMHKMKRYVEGWIYFDTKYRLNSLFESDIISIWWKIQDYLSLFNHYHFGKIYRNGTK